METKFKAGNIVKSKLFDTYFIVNKVTDKLIWLDGHSDSFNLEAFELDDYCIKHNNPRTRSECKMAGAVKNDAGKQPITLIPSDYILGTAKVFEFGGKKYGLHNFRLGMAHSRCLDAAMRHLLAVANGETIDPESGLPHIYHASCSLAMYDYMRINHPELNDIYEQTKKEPKPCEVKLQPTTEIKKSLASGTSPESSEHILATLT